MALICKFKVIHFSSFLTDLPFIYKSTPIIILPCIPDTFQNLHLILQSYLFSYFSQPVFYHFIFCFKGQSSERVNLSFGI